LAPNRADLDREAIARLETGLRFVAHRHLDTPEAVEECVQESLARGLDALRQGRVRSPDRLGAYFRGILHNVICDELRKRGTTVSLEGLPEPVARPGDALSALVTREQVERVRRALASLSEGARECLRLSFYEGLRPREIAARLGEPPARVRKRHSRALHRLREAYFAQGDGRPRPEVVTNPDTTRPVRGVPNRRVTPESSRQAHDR